MVVDTPSGVRILGPLEPGYDTVLTPAALAFVADLVRTFRDRVDQLLEARVEQQAAFDRGEPLAFRDDTRAIREGEWTVAPLPADLQDRRVEITGPVDRKMIINALNSGANVFMADFEDANAPTWTNLVDGQLNLRDAVRRTIRFHDPVKGKHYQLNEQTAVLMVRPRGWHLVEKHLLVDDRPAPAGLFDFGLYFFHNAAALLERGTGPYFYLPKLQSHLEARLWNDVFVRAQEALSIPIGTIKATVLIETLPASFVMDEILYELRDHSAGLNCGRWDYIFSAIKTFRAHADHVLPDRGQVGMDQHFMRSYTQRVIQTCHKREVHAMGGMAAQIPIKRDPIANAAAIDKVRTDKLREVRDGHDGTWVAHPGLVGVAREIFDEHMPTANQIHRKREDVSVTAADLTAVPAGTRTEAGLRHNVDVGLQYIASWLGGQGCVPIYDLMEDAATAEISRTQVWQWVRHGARLDDGRPVTAELFAEVLAEQLARLQDVVGAEGATGDHLRAAGELFEELVLAEIPQDFLTLPAYEHLLSPEARAQGGTR